MCFGYGIYTFFAFIIFGDYGIGVYEKFVFYLDSFPILIYSKFKESALLVNVFTLVDSNKSQS